MQLPQGLEELAAMDQASPQIEIEIEDPEAVTIGVDGMEIEIVPDKDSEDDFNANLAEFIGEDVLQSLASSSSEHVPEWQTCSSTFSQELPR